MCRFYFKFLTYPSFKNTPIQNRSLKIYINNNIGLRQSLFKTVSTNIFNNPIFSFYNFFKSLISICTSSFNIASNCLFPYDWIQFMIFCIKFYQNQPDPEYKFSSISLFQNYLKELLNWSILPWSLTYSFLSLTKFFEPRFS